MSPLATAGTETPNIKNYHTEDDTHYSCDQTDPPYIPSHPDSIHYYRSKLKSTACVNETYPGRRAKSGLDAVLNEPILTVIIFVASPSRLKTL